MNLKKHEFGAISMAMAVDPALLVEAKKRGFYNGGTKWERYFNDLFFGGGSVTYRQDVPADFTATTMTYLKHFMGSFEPKHEEKAAISALILSEIAIHPDAKETASEA